MATIQSQADPVQCCLKGQMFACPSNPVRRDIGLCPLYMGQRCAKKWDGYCDLFLSEKDDENVQGSYSNEFLRNAFESMFCQLDTKNPNSLCYERCEMFDPASSSPSFMVCKTVGDIAYRSTDNVFDLSGDFPQSGRLATASPIKMTACPKVCNVYQDLTDNNRLLNEVLDRNSCPDLVMNLAQNIVANRIPVTNRRLNDFINRYVVKPGAPSYSSIGDSNILTTTPMKTPVVNATLPQRPQASKEQTTFAVQQPTNTTINNVPTPVTAAKKEKYQLSSGDEHFDNPTQEYFDNSSQGINSQQEHYRQQQNTPQTAPQAPLTVASLQQACKRCNKRSKALMVLVCIIFALILICCFLSSEEEKIPIPQQLFF